MTSAPVGSSDGERTCRKSAQAETVAVPASALRLFLHLLTEMSQGNAVTLIPTHAEWTTQLTGYGIE